MRQYTAAPVNPVLALKIRVPSRTVYHLLYIPLNHIIFHEYDEKPNLNGYGGHRQRPLFTGWRARCESRNGGFWIGKWLRDGAEHRRGAAH